MSFFKRIEVTFTENEKSLYEYVESQQMRNATFIKHVLTEHMKGIDTVSVDYAKIKQALEEVIIKHGVTTTGNTTIQDEVVSDIKTESSNPLLAEFARRI